MHLVLDSVSYAYAPDGFTLGPLSMSLDSDSITALIGSNGSGKTTLIRVLINQVVSYAGTYRIDGADIRDTTGALLHRYGIGYAPEDPVLEERLSGLEIMQLLKEIHAVSDADFAAQLDECRTAFRLDAWFDTTPCREYSQGMRRKVSLVIALAGDPAYLVIDEPTNGLDPIAVFGLKKILARRARQGKGALVSSHMLDFVERIAREVLILNRGGVAFDGTVEHLLERFPGKPLDEIYYELFMDGSGGADGEPDRC